MVNMIKFLKEKKNKGFTLVETLVAITILVSAVVAPLTLAYRGLVAARFTKSQITASYLAQDAIEHVRSIRDGNVLGGSGWLTGLTSCTSGCKFDSFNNTVAVCTDATGCRVTQDATSGLYGHKSQWTNTPFSRKVTITNTGDEAEISVNITWQQGTISRSYTLKEHIFNWNN
jgi:prepilin-type N-terminal cleavage/methylation domain-containing protein